MATELSDSDSDRTFRAEPGCEFNGIRFGEVCVCGLNFGTHGLTHPHPIRYNGCEGFRFPETQETRIQNQITTCANCKHGFAIHTGDNLECVCDCTHFVSAALQHG